MRYASEKLSAAMNVLYEQNGNAPIAVPFNRVWSDSTGSNNQLSMTFLFNDVLTEISFARLSERPKERALKKIRHLASTFFAGLNNTNWEGFCQKFSVVKAIEELDNISDLLETAGMPRSSQLDREAVSSNTSSLLAAIDERDLPDQLKNIARIKLSSINKLLSAPGLTSDTQIAQHIKSVLADLLVDLDPFLEQDQELKDRILTWGKAGTHATVFALGLLANSATVYEMLPTQEEKLQIAAPQKQISVLKDEVGQ